MLRILATAAALLVVSPIAFAQMSAVAQLSQLEADSRADADIDTEAGRYILRRVDDGLMRVDRESGAVSFCRKRDEAWVCTAVADDRIALEDEIARFSRDNSKLAVEIGRLKGRIAQLEADVAKARAEIAARSESKPEEDPPTVDEKADKDRPRLDLPSDEDIDQVMKTFDSMMRRFLDMVRDLREKYEEDRT